MIRDILEGVRARLYDLYGPDHYYSKEYRLHEQHYWGAIPEWIQEDVALQVKNTSGMVSILDVGPGWGTLAAAVSRLYAECGRVLAIDRIPMVEQVVCSEYKIGYQKCDIERQRCPRAPFGWDLVIMTEVLEHFNFDPVPTLRKIGEQLSPVGRIYLSTPNRLDCWGKVRIYEDLASIPAYDPINNGYDSPPWYDGHVWQYTHAELLQTFEKAGLRVIRQGRCRSQGGGHLIYTLTV